MYSYISILACFACIGIGYVVYKLVWAFRIRKIRQEYRNMSERELRKKKRELSPKLNDFFSLKSSQGGCMPNKMLLLRHGCLLEEFEYRHLPE